MKKFWCFCSLMAVAASAIAQNIILKDGKVVPTKSVRRSGDTIMATIELPGTPAGQTPRTGELGYPIAQIAKVDFPEPALMKTAAGLINSGKAGEVLKQIEPVVIYYDNFRDTPGSWWTDVTMLKAQALISLGRNEEAERLADQMARAATDPETIAAARVYVAAGLARKGEHAKALQIYDEVLKAATRPQTLAVAALNKGLSLLARREWADALLSMLEVPVFYPRQEVLMPRVLLNAGRAYIGLEDYARAKVSLAELSSKFAATPEAAQAKTERERIARLEKSPEPAK